MRRSKRYRSIAKAVDKNKQYSITEALELIKTFEGAKFDETVEMVFKLGIDPRQSDQNVRGALPLPKGTGKTGVKVCVIASDKAADEAKAAGADFVGMEELIDKIKGGWIDFDVLIATPSAMPSVRPLGRVLGPRGLMPNPKTGTVTDNVGAAVEEAKAGRVEYRNDKGACVHVPVGKVSFSVEDLLENCDAIVSAILAAKPPASKGIYLQNATISSTMGPGVKVDTKSLIKDA
jgi:large subunit ribosomal protein L1